MTSDPEEPTLGSPDPSRGGPDIDAAVQKAESGSQTEGVHRPGAPGEQVGDSRCRACARSTPRSPPASPTRTPRTRRKDRCRARSAPRCPADRRRADLRPGGRRNRPPRRAAVRRPAPAPADPEPVRRNTPYSVDTGSDGPWQARAQGSTGRLKLLIGRVGPSTAGGGSVTVRLVLGLLFTAIGTRGGGATGVVAVPADPDRRNRRPGGWSGFPRGCGPRPPRSSASASC